MSDDARPVLITDSLVVAMNAGVNLDTYRIVTTWYGAMSVHGDVYTLASPKPDSYAATLWEIVGFQEHAGALTILGVPPELKRTR